MAEVTATHLLAQIKAFREGTDGDIETRQKLHEAARQLAFDTEDATTALFRNTLGITTQLATQRMALGIGIFPALTQDGTFKSLSQLAESTRADPVLLLRLLRALSTFGLVQEGENKTYRLRRTSQVLGDTAFNEAVGKVLELIEPLAGALPVVIHDNGRRNPTDRFHGAAQKAFNAPGKELFEILMGQGPEAAKAFSVFLSAASNDSDKLHDLYPVDARLIQGYDAKDYFWVDVGGGFGQFTLDLMKTFPNLPQRCLVQDQQMVVAQARLKGLDKLVQFQEHDFFQEQPVKGARTYYFRQCFHNWQDSFCKTMLEQTAKVMKSGYSRLLIHELVMPECGATPWQVMMDTLMMAGYSTEERSEKQWHDLVASAGLKIHKIYSKPVAAESIIEIIKE